MYQITFRYDVDAGQPSPFTVGGCSSTVHTAIAVQDGQDPARIDLLSDERFAKPDANLRYFREKYDSILAGHDERRDMLASVRASP